MASETRTRETGSRTIAVMWRSSRDCAAVFAAITGSLSVCVSFLGLLLYPFQYLPGRGLTYVFGFFVGSLIIGGLLGLIAGTLEQKLSGWTRYLPVTGILFAALFLYVLPHWVTIFQRDWLNRRAVVGVVALFGASVVFGILGGWFRFRGWRSVTNRQRGSIFALLFLLAILLPSMIRVTPVKDTDRAKWENLASGGERSWTEADVPMPETIIVVSFDALRADHLSAYGYERQTSPELDRLVQDAVLFEHATTPKPKTGPSLGSLLTGLYPPRHGLRRMGWVLSENVQTIADRMGNNFLTAAFVANPIVGEAVRQAGFAHLRIYDKTAAPDVLKDALNWLKAHGEAKVFLWIHLFEPHTPYSPPSEDLARFVDDEWYDVGSRVDYDVDAAARKLGLPSITEKDRAEVRAEVNRTVAKYDAYVRFSTRCAARFLSDVLKIRRSPLFVVTSDHGESMVEHNLFFWHGSSCYEELIGIPLIIYHPDSSLLGRVSTPASLVDIVPTICALVGCTGTQKFDGTNLLGRTDNGLKGRAVFASARDNPFFSSWAITKNRWKLILDPLRLSVVLDGIMELRAEVLSWFSLVPRPTNPYRYRTYRYELYDLDTDPMEKSNLAPSQFDRRDRLASELMEWLDYQFRSAGAEGVEEDQLIAPEVEELLQSLGYANPR